ncbi:MAG: gliding motility-associated C-terminal domain-containing protein [Bacteroidia bacterium]
MYNRWGELVYQSNKDFETNEVGNWNGKFMNSGPKCPSGTYYYIFNYSLDSNPNKMEQIEGVIYLIR